VPTASPATPDQNHKFLARILEILAPGKSDLVAMFEAYFDESGTHDGAHVLCVAGYLFESEACLRLDLAWKEMLEKYNLPHFHMKDCAPNKGVFSHLTMDECDRAEREAIALIHKHALFGSAITVNEPEYNTWAARRELGSAYKYCCWLSIKSMKVWLDQNNIGGDISYFFEAGCEHSAETSELLDVISSSDELSREHRYNSHSFVKKKTRPVQTPDIFAWLHANHFEQKLKGRKMPRKDYEALIRGCPSKAFIATRETVSPKLVFGHPELRDHPFLSAPFQGTI